MINQKISSSFIQKTDPRIKIIITFMFALSISTATNSKAILTGLFFSISLILISNTNIKSILKKLLIVNIFLIFLILIIPFSYPGKEIFSLFNYSYSLDGIKYVIKIMLKSNTIIISTIILLGSIEVLHLIHALRHLHIPDKLVDLFYFYYRYIFEMKREYNKLKDSLKVKSFNPGTNIHTYKTYAYLMGILLIRAYEKAERIYQAMLCRGFTGKFWIWKHFHSKETDYIFLILSTTIIIFINLLQWKIITL